MLQWTTQRAVAHSLHLSASCSLSFDKNGEGGREAGESENATGAQRRAAQDGALVHGVDRGGGARRPPLKALWPLLHDAAPDVVAEAKCALPDLPAESAFTPGRVGGRAKCL